MARGRKPTKKNFKRGNGTGSIKKLSGNRRKPFAAIVTTDYIFNPDTLTQKQVQKPLGYFETRELAEQALNEYYRDPYDIELNTITFAEVYKNFSDRYYKELKNPSSIRVSISAFNCCKSLHNKPFKTITIANMRDCIDMATDSKGVKISAAQQGRVKSLFNLMYDYACEANIVQINIARNFHIKDMGKKIRKAKKTKKAFSSDQVELLWKNIDYPYVRMILIAIYTGFRPHELCIIERNNVHIDENYIIGGEKTEAGANRYVPIHPKILELIKYYYKQSEGKQYLINAPDGQQGTTMTYDKYRGRFSKALTYSGIPASDFSPHCTRHTFVTFARINQMDELALKLIIGHENNSDVTNMYDHSNKHELLQSEILKLKY